MKQLCFITIAVVGVIGLFGFAIQQTTVLPLNDVRSSSHLTNIIKPATPEPSMHVQRTMASMPLAFTENQGQWDDKVLFRADAGGATMWFTDDGAHYQFTRRAPKTGGSATLSGNDVTLSDNDVTLSDNDVTLGGNEVTLSNNDVTLIL